MKQNKTIKCYISGEILTPENSNDEHIIQDFLGGKLKSKALMTSDWNDEFGKTIDKSLSKSIVLDEILGIPSGSGKAKKKFKGKDNENKRYDIKPGKFQGTEEPTKPKIIKDKDGNELLCVAGDKSRNTQFIESEKKKNPSLTEAEIAKRVRIEERNEKREVYHENYLGPISGINPIRAIAKIAANYYVFMTKDIEWVQPLVPLIRDSFIDRNRVTNFYDFSLKDLAVSKHEVSHILYLEGNPKEGLLFCYLELFNTYCFMVLINEYYTGECIRHYYKNDLITGKTTQSPPKFDIPYLDIRRLKWKEKGLDKEFENRCTRAMKLYGGELTTKPNQKNNSI